MSVVVYKLGGSLLSLPDLASRLIDLFESQDAHRPLLVVGGGAMADVVRGWDRTHHLPAEISHWLAIRAMCLNASMVQGLLPGARLVANREVAERAWSGGRPAILNAHDFLKSEEAASQIPLEHSWNATSDSIAAWATIHWPADRLVLLKSTAASADGVDGYFSRLHPHLPQVDWVNLRDEPAIFEPFDQALFTPLIDISRS